MIPRKTLFKAVAANKEMHVLCRSIARGYDGIWKTFVNGKWLMSLPEFDDGFGTNVPQPHRMDKNALYFGPAPSSLKMGLDWWEPERLQLSINALLGFDRYTYISRNFPWAVAEPIEVHALGIQIGTYFWRFEHKNSFMKLLLKYEPFEARDLQAFRMEAAANYTGNEDYIATRIVNTRTDREFYVMMEGGYKNG